jgi:hypothetical protein
MSNNNTVQNSDQCKGLLYISIANSNHYRFHMICNPFNTIAHYGTSPIVGPINAKSLTDKVLDCLSRHYVQSRRAKLWHKSIDKTPKQ